MDMSHNSRLINPHICESKQQQPMFLAFLHTCVCVMWTGIMYPEGLYHLSHDCSFNRDVIPNTTFVYSARKLLQLSPANPMKPSQTRAALCASQSTSVCTKSCTEVLVPEEGTIFSACTLRKGKTQCSHTWASWGQMELLCGKSGWCQTRHEDCRLPPLQESDPFFS